MSENPKNPIAEREEEILKFWKERQIFEKTLEKPSPKGEFVFYEGPPTANGRPGIHHLESRAFKDLIPRFKTMQGFHVRRKGGWDTHGLPVEIEVEKTLNLKSKKEIEEYGIAEFNEKCKESVWKYIHEWEEFTERIAYFIDLKRPYITYKPYYIESLWNIVKTAADKKLLYKDYKVLPWCPRCQTALSSHELAQGYQDVKDLSVTVKFRIKSEKDTYILAWTTTPWTLPGNVALAVGRKIKYIKVKSGSDTLILAKDRISVLKDIEYEVAEEFTGDKLIGLEYEPLFPFLSEKLKTENLQLKALKNAFKVYPANFVSTEEGTGIVHTAVMYGQDDFELGAKENLPKHHLVNENGTFMQETGFLSEKFVKDETTDVLIIRDLAGRGALFRKEKYEHSYPFCWRCKTPLIYFARDSWYMKMSALRDKLIKENQKINWEPNYIKNGRFGEWLKEVKDWAISRERFWGTPLPVWQCQSCQNHDVVGSFEELFLKNKSKHLTRLVLLRHSESQKNVPEMFDSSRDSYGLTSRGEKEAEKTGKILKNLEIDFLYSSPVRRAKETAEIIGSCIGKKTLESEKLWEVRNGDWEGKLIDDPSVLESRNAYNKLPDKDYYVASRGRTGESWQDVEKRVASFAEEVLEKHKGKTVVIISHEGPLIFLLRHLKNLSLEELTNLWEERRTFHRGILGGFAELTSVFVDNKTGKEIDPHRPQVDEIIFNCQCGGEMKRVKEVMDVWFDSGAMPFAQDHYPFKGKEKERIDKDGFPADFIAEAIDQTRGWFYTLHAVGVLMGKGRAYKNVVCLGHLLDKNGKKMSKSLGNVVIPKEAIDKFGVDTLRLWMYSVNQPGESKNFDEQTIDEVAKKNLNPLINVLAFYRMYKNNQEPLQPKIYTTSKNVLDEWILVKLHKLISEVTEQLENYKITETVRNLREFILDLSQWYLRRSRERFKSEDNQEKEEAIQTLGFVLKELSKLLAPFIPFFSEHLFQQIKSKNDKESVHLENWPKHEAWNIKHGAEVLENMNEVRKIVSKALEYRAKTGIKVRQPLPSIKIKSLKLKGKENFLKLIKDEVNVKEVVFDKELPEEVGLDTNITPELKKEGQLRELVRQIQEMRKKNNLKPHEEAEFIFDQSSKDFISQFEREIYRQAKVKVKFAPGGINLNDLIF